MEKRILLFAVIILFAMFFMNVNYEGFASKSLSSKDTPVPIPKEVIDSHSSYFNLYVDGELLIKLKRTQTINQLINSQDIIEEIGSMEYERLFPNKNDDLRDIYLLKYSKRDINPKEVVKKILKTGYVEIAEPNLLFNTTQMAPIAEPQPIYQIPPNDLLYSTQWHLPKISAEGAWDIVVGDDSCDRYGN